MSDNCQFSKTIPIPLYTKVKGLVILSLWFINQKSVDYESKVSGLRIKSQWISNQKSVT